MDRRAAIAQAAVRIIARDGLRGLTHRAVDRELGVGEGTTSNYARTRADLLELVVRDLAAHTASDLDAVAPDRLPDTVDGAVDLIIGIFDRAVAREVEQRARFALAVALAPDPELHGMLTESSPVRNRLLAAGEAVLASLGVPEAAQHAVDLVGIVDGLLYDRLAGHGLRGTPVDVRGVLTAWLTGTVYG